MHIPTLLYILNGILSGEHDLILPSEVEDLVPNSQDAVKLSAAISDQILERLIDTTITGSLLSINLVLVVLHTRASVAASEGRMGDAERAFRAILQIVPTDVNVRSALALMLQNMPEQVIAILDPAVEQFSLNVPSHRMALEAGALAAFATDNDTFISRMPADENEPSSPMVRAVVQRLRRLHALKERAPHQSSEDVDSGTAELRSALAATLKALDEHAAVVAIDAALQLLRQRPASNSSHCTEAAVLICALMFAERWPQAWRSAQGLLAELLVGENDIAIARSAWQAQALPQAAFAGLLVLATRREGEFGRDHALKRISDVGALTKFDVNAPAGLEEARDAWRNMLLDGRFEELKLFAPIAFSAIFIPQEDGSDIALASTAIPSPPDTGVPLWYFVTWHEHVGQLLRLIPVLQGEKQTIVVSIGGSKPPEEIGVLSTLLLIDRLHLLFRPAVTWGGPKLLYQNALEVFDAFDKLAENNAWFQIICNRSYPLLSGSEIGKLIAHPDFLQRHPSIPAPPAWRGEWPNEVVDQLPDIFDKAFQDVLETNKLAKMRTLAFDDMRRDTLSFNFASTPKVLEKDFKDKSHQYAISAYSADMRWMSFGRMTEFIDTATENGYTFSRRLPLHILKWIHSVLMKHTLHTGDPFVLMDQRYIQTVLHDPDCIELFAAMNLGFGPEMNFMDTVAASKQYGLFNSLGHQYYRTARYEATDDDIGPANSASTIERRFFMRKTSPVISENFIRYFSNKISEDWPDDRASFVLDVVSKPSLPAADLPSIQDLLDTDICEAKAALRDLTGRALAQVRFGRDGRIWHDASDIGGWRLDKAGLTTEFQINDWGAKLYERPMSSADVLTLAPAEIVSARNSWSVFIDMDLDALLSAHASPEYIIEPHAVLTPTGGWSISRSPTAALLDAFVLEDLPDYPAPVRHEAFGTLTLREADGQVLALCRIGGHPVLLRYVGFVFAANSGKAVFERTSMDDIALWEKATDVEIHMAVTPADIVGRYRLQLLDRRSIIALDPDGRIKDEAGEAVGTWFADKGGIRLFGLEGLRTGWVRQFQSNKGRMRLSGWGWRDIQNSAAFSLEAEAAHGSRLS